MQWLVSDVPKVIQDKIDHERYIDQRERWSSKKSDDLFKDAVIASDAVSKILKRANANARTSIDENHTTSNRTGNEKRTSSNVINTKEQ